MNHPALTITLGLLTWAYLHHIYTRPITPGARAQKPAKMNRYTCINSDGELATTEGGTVLAWHHRPNARAATKAQPGKWSIVTVGSRRYEKAVAHTFHKTARPQIELQDSPDDESEN